VKKIKNQFEREIGKVLREARYLSKLNHVNIVRYYQSWLEITLNQDKSPKKKRKAQFQCNESELSQSPSEDSFSDNEFFQFEDADQNSSSIQV